MNVIELNKTYKFEIENFSFGDLNREDLIKVFTNGSTSSTPLEIQLTKWFPQLTRIEGCRDHDHVDLDGVKYDAKNFTKYGLKFMPSNQIGEGRSFDAEVAHEKAKKLIYICCDILDFPRIRVKFAKGEDLIKQYPNCTISKGNRDKFFGAKELING